MIAATALQAGIYDVLQNDPGLKLEVSGIYDQPPAMAEYPYVTFGETSHQARHLKDRRGANVSFDVHVWTNEASQMQAKTLSERIDNILHDTSLEIEGYEVVNFRLINAGVIRQFNEAGPLFRGRLTYAALLYAVEDRTPRL